MIYPKSIATLIEQFQKFPSVGPKSAQRMAFHLLRMPMPEVENLQKLLLMQNKIPIRVRFVLIFLQLVLARFVHLLNVIGQLYA